MRIGPAHLRAGDTVCIFLNHLISALLGHLAEIEQLGLGMLVQC